MLDGVHVKNLKNAIKISLNLLSAYILFVFLESPSV